MAFSMHSHSGQFCPGHAKDSLEDIIQTAISRGMQTFAVTEHMPRNLEKDLYPEEIEAGTKIDHTYTNHKAYILEAVRLRQKYAAKITLLIGFESEWIRPSYMTLTQELAANENVDFFIGSVHHVHEIPIDYGAHFYSQAREVAGGTDERLFKDYFDSQYEMLIALKPKVVGHFDLIRLLSDNPNCDLREMKGVWERVVRNLRIVVEQGGLIEINSSALRKGLKEPYPGRSVCTEFLGMGGRLTLSDDSHGVEQVGTNFLRAIGYLESLGVKELFVLGGKDSRSSDVCCVTLSGVKESFRE